MAVYGKIRVYEYDRLHPDYKNWIKLSDTDYIVKLTAPQIWKQELIDGVWATRLLKTIDWGDCISTVPVSEGSFIWGHESVTITKSGLPPNQVGSLTINIFGNWTVFGLSSSEYGVATWSGYYLLPGNYSYYFWTGDLQTLHVSGPGEPIDVTFNDNLIYEIIPRPWGDLYENYDYYLNNNWVASSNTGNTIFVDVEDLKNNDDKKKNKIKEYKEGDDDSDESEANLEFLLDTPQVEVIPLSVSALIKWKPSLCLDTEFLNIYINSELIKMEDPNLLETQILGLEPNTPYLFEFEFKGGGEVSKRVKIYIVTYSSTPFFKVIGADESSVWILFDSIITAGDISYIMFYLDNELPINITSNDWSSFIYHVENLIPGQSYISSCSVIYEDGTESPRSAPVFLRTLPAKVENVEIFRNVVDQKFEITWDAVENSTYYEILLTDNHNITMITHQTRDNKYNMNYGSIIGDWLLKIRAANEGGAGQYSDLHNLIMAIIPDPVRISTSSKEEGTITSRFNLSYKYDTAVSTHKSKIKCNFDDKVDIYELYYRESLIKTTSSPNIPIIFDASPIIPGGFNPLDTNDLRIKAISKSGDYVWSNYLLTGYTRSFRLP